jgi:short-subunit dehydrogenase
LGRCIVRKLTERGCNVLIVDDNLAKIEQLAEEVKSEHVKVSVYCAKTCENHDVFRLFDEVNEKFGDIDLLVRT